MDRNDESRGPRRCRRGETNSNATNRNMEEVPSSKRLRDDGMATEFISGATRRTLTAAAAKEKRRQAPRI